MDKQIRLGKLLKKIIPLLVFIVIVFLYGKTVQRDVGYWDAAEMQTVGYTFDIAHPTGYPTYIIITKLLHILFFWITPISLRANFISLVYVVLGLIFFYKNIIFFSKSRLIASSATLAMAVHKDLWQVATYADVFSLHFLFLNLILYVFLTNQKRGFCFPFVLGLSLGNHMTSVFFLPLLGSIFYQLIKRRHYKKLFFQLIILFSTVVLLYSTLWIISITKGQFTSNTNLSQPIELLHYISGSDFAANKKFIARIVTTTNYNSFFTNLYSHFPTTVIPIFLICILTGIIAKPLVFLPVSLTLFFHTNFTLNYQNGYLDRYYIISISLVILIITSIVIRAKRKLKAPAVTVLSLMFLTVFFRGVLANYQNMIQRKDFSSRSWVNNTFNTIEPNGVIFSWWSYSTSMWYMQKVESVRPDIIIVNTGQGEWEKKAELYLAKHPVYFIENITTQKYRLSPVGNLYKLENH